MLSLIFAGAFFLLCLFASLKDLASLTIPNWVNAGFVLLFFPAALALGISWETFGLHLLLGFVALVAGFALFSFNFFGGGDAKMIPGVLLWLGPAGALTFLMMTALAGGVLAIAILLARKTVPEPFAPGFVRATMQDGAGVPYAIAITAGAIAAAPLSPFLTEFLSQFSEFH
ncbi:MAG: prepilin peptidase [Hyphomonadaceae bacterium]